MNDSMLSQLFSDEFVNTFGPNTPEQPQTSVVEPQSQVLEGDVGVGAIPPAEPPPSVDPGFTPPESPDTGIAATPDPGFETPPETPVDEGAAPLAPTPNSPEEFEQIWRDQYNVEAKDIIGEETYNKLKSLSEEQLTPGQLIGLMGVLVTNPELGMRMIDSKESRKAGALDALTKLETSAASFRKAGMAEIARTKREEAKIESREKIAEGKVNEQERRSRAKFASDVMGEVQKNGLPAGLVTPPTEEQLNDPQLFWEEWYPQNSDNMSKYMGRKEVDQWLLSKTGPTAIITAAAADPATGIEEYLKSTGLFTPEEIEARRPMMKEFTKAAVAEMRAKEADVKKTNAQAAQATAATAKYREQIDAIKAKTATIGELTPGQKMNLEARLMGLKQDMISKQMLWFELSDRYANAGLSGDDRDYSDTTRSFLSGITDLDLLLGELNEFEQRLQGEAVSQTMTINEAMAPASMDALQTTFNAYGDLFSSPEEVQGVVFSDKNPGNPQLQEARNFFYTSLLIQMHALTNIHPDNLVGLLDSEENSLLDQTAGADVSFPNTAAPMASGAIRNPPTSPIE